MPAPDDIEKDIVELLAWAEEFRKRSVPSETDGTKVAVSA